MLKKIDRSRLFLAQHPQLFRCPVCHEKMTAQDYSLICQMGHRFDLSKKGTLYFLEHQIKSGYDQKMFAPRGRMIQSGMYAPVTAFLAELLQDSQMILDVGCGEGSFLKELVDRQVKGTLCGFDIAKEGVYLATNQPFAAFWCVADLTNLPFDDGSIDTVLNIFSPSHYEEFRRVLRPGGQVVKVVPQAGYLKELRAAFYPDQKARRQYSNAAVVEKFKEQLDDVSIQRVCYTFDIPQERRLDLLEMSPLEWQVSQQIKTALQADPLKQITIDVEILKGNKSKRFL